MSADAIFWLAAFAVPALLGVAAFRVVRSSGTTARPLTVVGGNLVVLGFLFSIVFFAAETYYRYVYDTTDAWNRSRTSKRWFERYWQRNAQGLRDNVDYALPRADGVRRVTFVGDSFTAAHGIKDVDDRFVNRIRRARPEWEVHAVAINGFNTREEILELRRIRDAGYEVDVIVLVYCHNDIDTYIPEYQKLYKREISPLGPVAKLVSTSYALDFYVNRAREWALSATSDVPYVELRRTAYEGVAWQSLAHGLGLMVSDAERWGADFGVVTFPWMRLSLAGEDDLAMYRVLDAFWRERGVPHLNLLEVFAPFEPETLVVSERDTHPSVRAHAIAAQAILQFIEKSVIGGRAKHLSE